MSDCGSYGHDNMSTGVAPRGSGYRVLILWIIRDCKVRMVNQNKGVFFTDIKPSPDITQGERVCVKGRGDRELRVLEAY